MTNVSVWTPSDVINVLLVGVLILCWLLMHAIHWWNGLSDDWCERFVGIAACVVLAAICWRMAAYVHGGAV